MRQSLVSAACEAEQRGLPSPWEPGSPPPQAAVATGLAVAALTPEATAAADATGAAGAAAGAVGGAGGACVAARYVRLVCVAKRRGLEAEPFVVRRLGVLPLLAMAGQDEILGDNEGGGEGGTSREGGGAAASAARGNTSGGGAAPKAVKRSAAAEAARTAREARRARETALLRDGFDFESVGVGRPLSRASVSCISPLCLVLAVYHPSRWAASRSS